jgi:MFS family permease
MIREDTFAYCISLLVIFVDTMGVQFTAPVLVPYAISLGISIEQVGLLYTTQFVGEIFGNMLMPKLSDARGRSVVVYLSMIGSTVAYLLIGITYLTDEKFSWFVGGKFMSGLFGGTFPVMLAYIADLTIFQPPHVTKAESQLLRVRTTSAGAMLFTIPMALAPIGGAVSTFGLHLPFLVSAAVAFLGLLVSCRYMEEASVIKLRASKKQEALYQSINMSDNTSAADESKAIAASEDAPTERGRTSSGKVLTVDNSVSTTDDRHTHGLGMQIDASLCATVVAEGGQAIAGGITVGDVITKMGDVDFTSGQTDVEAVAALTAAKDDGVDIVVEFNGGIIASEDKISSVVVVPTDPSPSVSDDEKLTVSTGTTTPTPSSAVDPAETSKESNSSPWADPVLLILGAAFFFLGVMSVGMMLLPPLLLAGDTYGLQLSTVQETQEKISITFGLMSVCSGVPMVFCMYVGYLWLVNKGWSDVSCIVLGGGITTIALTVMPFTTAIWHVAVLFVMQGAGQGVFVGAMMSMPNQYLTKLWPKKMAQGRAVYNQFRAIGMLIAPLVLTNTFDRAGIKPAFFVVGGSCAAMMLGVALFAFKQKRAIEKYDAQARTQIRGGEHAGEKTALTSEERKKLLAEGALPKEKFLKALTQRVGSKLEGRNYFAVPKNAEAQYLIDELIDRALPQLPMWEDDDDGEKHLEGIARLYLGLNMPGRMHSLEERHGLDLSSMHGLLLDSILDSSGHNSMQGVGQGPLPRMFMRTDSDSSITSRNSSISISSIGADGKIARS